MKRKRIHKDRYIIVNSEDFGSFSFRTRKDTTIVLKVECDIMSVQVAKREAMRVALETGNTNINLR